MRIRDYDAADREACLALFDGNTPVFFAPEERDGFANFLDRLPGPYLVILDDDAIVGCGGWALDADQAVLCWGMVRRDRHHSGLGRRLVQARLERIATEHGAIAVRVDTSQHSAGFFSRMGFRTSRIVPDGHAPGIDLHEMILKPGS